ncbi:WD domain, G-beta repeat protein (macronuclear) [Tetrahymena thermophila SB210]|uniref:WD domain, G-beta repeat protein n=1 Tax=Tetrahymena thermophila (strain SB210) TaxID=312017 RepID=I7LXH1_TETTS|nr:WD domain, G-beta repeat protein [Tetrahymena thermophila SB210]EAS04633.2 WD domain, G-beta repeat protein [Tetrahymena thermophila SB210]|eukprot:XP_001024878.2 WD domain, G-beta repeat protein [Tetrahymena thermophila SB210]
MDIHFQVADNELYLLILKFLKERGLFKSYIALETETKTSLVKYPSELAILRKLILEGEFEESEQFLVPFIEKFSFKMNPAMYEIKKQYFLELLEIGPDYQIMTRLLKSIQQFTSKENYKRLFFLLSIENIKEHPDYANWSPEMGRLECFEKVKNCIEEVYNFGQQDENIIHNELPQIIEKLINNELKDKQKFERVISECYKNNSNQLSILDDSIISQSAAKYKVNFFSDQEDKTPAFDAYKSVNFPFQAKQQQQGQRVNIQGQTSVTQAKPFFSVIQKNNKIENESVLNSQLHQSQLQQIQNEIKRNELDFMELDESQLEESHQTEFLENYQNKIRQQPNRSMIKGQKLLASNNNPSMDGSSYYYGPGFVQSEHLGNNQNWDSNYYSQSMPPQQQVQGLKPVSNNNQGAGKSQALTHSQQSEQEKKLQNQLHHLIKESNNSHQALHKNLENSLQKQQLLLQQQQQINQQEKKASLLFINQQNQENNVPAELLTVDLDMVKSSSVKNMKRKQLFFHYRNKQNHKQDIPFINFQNINNQQGSEEDQYTNQNQEGEDYDEDQEDEDIVNDDDDIQENEGEEDNDVYKQQHHNQLNFYRNQENQEQSQAESRNFGYNQSELIDEQNQTIQNKGKQFYGGDNNQDYEERTKKSSNKSNLNSLNQSAASTGSKLRQSNQGINQHNLSELGAKISQQSAQSSQIKESGVSQHSKNKQGSSFINNPSNTGSAVQNQGQDQEDFQLYSFPKEFFNQTTDLSKQGQYSQVKQPQQSKSQTWQHNQQTNNLNYQGQLQNKGNFSNTSHQKNHNQNLQESQRIFSYDYTELIEVCQIQDSQPIRTAQFSPDGEFFALGTNSKSIKCFSIKEIVKNYRKNETSFPIWEKKNHHDGSIYTIDWSKTIGDKQFIATGSLDMTIKVIRVPTFQSENLEKEFKTVTLNGHKGIVRTLRFHPDSTQIYSAGLPDTSIMIWDLEKKCLLGKLDGHTNAINSLDIDGEGNTLVSVSKDNTLRVWDLKANKQIRCIDLTNKKYDQLNYVNLNNGFSNTNLKNLLKFSKKQIKSAVNENTACVAHTNGLVSVWDLNNPSRSLYEIKNHTADCRSVEFDPTGNYMISTSFDKSICIYNIEEEKIVTKINNHSDRVVLSKFHPFFPFVLSTSADSTSRVFAPSEFIKNFQC